MSVPLSDLKALKKMYDAQMPPQVPVLKAAGVNPVIPDHTLSAVHLTDPHHEAIVSPPLFDIPSPEEIRSLTKTQASETSEGGNKDAEDLRHQAIRNVFLAGPYHHQDVEIPPVEPLVPDGGGHGFTIHELESILGFQRYEVQMSRPPPPLLELAPGEMAWMNPENAGLKLQWDGSMCEEGPSKATEIRDLIVKAFKEPLLQAQMQQVLKELEVESMLVYNCGLTPQRLPDLVEYNPMIAIECLLKLMNSNQITEYLTALGPSPCRPFSCFLAPPPPPLPLPIHPLILTYNPEHRTLS
jgi:hypothetical protein